jgi:hypothetical protein
MLIVQNMAHVESIYPFNFDSLHEDPESEPILSLYDRRRIYNILSGKTTELEAELLALELNHAHQTGIDDKTLQLTLISAAESLHMAITNGEISITSSVVKRFIQVMRIINCHQKELSVKEQRSYPTSAILRTKF